MENTITISKQEYIMLTRMAERIDTLERLLDYDKYADITTIRVIIGIPAKEEEDDDGKF